MIAKHRMERSKRFYDCPLCLKEHPSISTLLSVIASPALMGWAAKNGTAKLLTLQNELVFGIQAFEPGREQSIAQSILEMSMIRAEKKWVEAEGTAFWKSGKEIGAEAADYGTQAHAWIEAHLRGVEVSLDALPGPARASVEQMLKWEKEHHLETIKTEQTFYNCKFNYAGTADWLGQLDGELSLGDWKTSSGIFFNYIIQGWGYCLADETQNADRLYRQIFIGRFGKDATSEVKIYKRNDFPSIETAREVIQACGVIFAAQCEYERRFPYVKKQPTNGGTTP